MYRLTFTQDDNVLGSTPIVNLYRLINQQHPTLGLTQVNSRITLLINHTDRLNPHRAYLQIARVSAPYTTYEFQYDRLNVSELLQNPVFTEEELIALKPIPTSTALLEALAAKLNMNFTEDDFWVDASGIEYAGGSIHPNWILKARFDSIFWCGKFNVHLN